MPIFPAPRAPNARVVQPEPNYGAMSEQELQALAASVGLNINDIRRQIERADELAAYDAGPGYSTSSRGITVANPGAAIAGMFIRGKAEKRARALRGDLDKAGEIESKRAAAALELDRRSVAAKAAENARRDAEERAFRDSQFSYTQKRDAEQMKLDRDRLAAQTMGNNADRAERSRRAQIEDAYRASQSAEAKAAAKADSEAAKKQPMFQAAATALDRLDESSRNLAGGGGFFEGRLPAIGEKSQQYEGDAAQLLAALTAATRVPGIGAQSDTELRQMMASLPTRTDSEAVRQRKIAGIRQRLEALNVGGGDDPVAAEKARRARGGN